jgi:hypothetical protein
MGKIERSEKPKRNPGNERDDQKKVRRYQRRGRTD